MKAEKTNNFGDSSSDIVDYNGHTGYGVEHSTS